MKKNRMPGKLIVFVLLCCSMVGLSGCNVASDAGEAMPYVNDFMPVFYQASDEMTPPFSLMGEEVCVISGNESNQMTITSDEENVFDGEAILVIRESDLSLLYQENVYEKIYPASLTKLMTAYTVYALNPDLEQEYCIPAEAVQLPDNAAKRCGLKEGDVITLHELLHASLISSANEATRALAMALCGTEEEFTKKMNEYAKELGATQSHFVNTHGLHDESHYTSLYDLYLIFHALLQNEDFVSIIGKEQYELKYHNAKGEEVTKLIASTNQYFTGGKEVPNSFSIVGGKTGTTNAAGNCMMLSCTDEDGHSYIVSVLHAGSKNELYSELNLLFESIATLQ